PDPPIIAPNQDVLDAGNNTKISGTGSGDVVGFASAHPIWFTVIAAVAIATPVAIVKNRGGSSSNPNGTKPTPGHSRGLPPGN
ncbi:MAG TPA: hypothetical protein VGR39_02005, partial [Candidatus Acidoferrales bacterium]|nr:hypothetical protein [Candidatus Acidoferrales bacterium]